MMNHATTDGKRVPAIVMNMYYTGLGIARSLGERGISVIGLTAKHGIYGNFTRYAKTVFCPDSRSQPEQLLLFLVDFGRKLGKRSILFPTRDDDLVFLDRFRSQLEPYYSIVAPLSSVLNACLDKFETYRAAKAARIATPRCWLLHEPDDLNFLDDVTYPCVLKPVSAYQWRRDSSWLLVGGRKAIGIVSKDELRAEYLTVARVEKRALVQEMVTGGDECLLVMACYLDRDSRYVAGFQVRKLIQVPEGMGTGCIVQSVTCTELVGPTIRLLETMRFTGIAEVEYKWDARSAEYKLIEINARPWDQHRLGAACGVDLIYLAYCEHAGLPLPRPQRSAPGSKWIAEDTFFTTALQMAWRRDPRLSSLFRHARGKRLFAIWSIRDPLPLIVYAFMRFLPDLMAAAVRWLWAGLRKSIFGKNSGVPPKRGLVYESHQEN